MPSKPYSDAEIRPETPEILRWLEKRHYPKITHKDTADRGIGIRDIDDPNVSEQAQDAVPLIGHAEYDMNPVNYSPDSTQAQPGPRMLAINAQHGTQPQK